MGGFSRVLVPIALLLSLAPLLLQAEIDIDWRDDVPSRYLAPPLQFDYYKETCPDAGPIVQKIIEKWSKIDPTNPGPLLRLFFHDCFVQGCDGSVLINSTTENQAEKDASINFSLGDFYIIDEIKEELENECPGIVSCADVLALVAVYSIKQAGGPLYPIELGRRDQLTSYAPSSQTFLPAFSLNVSGLSEDVRTVGLDITDLVALSGAHTIGQAHCSSLKNRLYPHIDPVYPKSYGEELLANCTDNGSLTSPNFDSNTQFFQDPVTPLVFDNQYYKNLKTGLGLFTSDVSLFQDPRTVNLVEYYAENQAAFFEQFGISLRKMGKIGVLSGTQGQIRKQCWVRNSRNADPAFDPDIEKEKKRAENPEAAVLVMLIFASTKHLPKRYSNHEGWVQNFDCQIVQRQLVYRCWVPKLVPLQLLTVMTCIIYMQNGRCSFFLNLVCICFSGLWPLTTT